MTRITKLLVRPLLFIVMGLSLVSCDIAFFQRGPFSLPINLPLVDPPGPPGPGVTPNSAIGIRIAPDPITLTMEGQQQKVQVLLEYSNGDTEDVTDSNETVYSVSDGLVASASAAGVITPVESGNAHLEVTHQSFSASVAIEVNLPPPALIAIRTDPEMLVFDDPAERKQLQVFGMYSRGPDQDLTDPAAGTTYTVDRAQIAAVDSIGRSAPIARGDAQITVMNDGLAAMVPVMVVFCRPPSPVLDAHVTMTRDATMTLTGQSEPGAEVEVFGPMTNEVVTADAAGRFTADVSLAINRTNTLYLTTIADCGARSSPTTTTIVRDTEWPFVYIDFPNDSPIEAERTDVAGRVSDTLSGFRNLEVKVNGVSAIVNRGIGTNGTFFLPNLPLNVGDNTITAVATDALGNANTHEIVITRDEIPEDAPIMTVVSGNGQSAMIHEALPEPIVVKVTKSDGVTPFVNKVVTFEVTRSDSRLYASLPASPLAGVMTYQTRTDDLGLAQAFWILGSSAGSGNARVQVRSRSIAGTVAFCASTLPGFAAQINIGTGNNQRAEIGSIAPEPFRAWVSDSCNGIPNVDVRFTVTRGGGKVIGPDGMPQDMVIVPTSDTGHAQVGFLLGPDVGNNFVEAQFVGNPTGAATFNAYGVARASGAGSIVRGGNDPDVATFSGMIQDNSNQPLGGAGVRLLVNGQPAGQTTSLPNGTFQIEDIMAAGKADLYIDSASIDAINGEALPANLRFPDMHYETHVVPGASNSLAMNVMLPPLNTANDFVYHWNQATDLELTCEGMEGLKLIVKAGTTITLADGNTRIGPAFPPVAGEPTRPGQVTLALNQVHHDNVPMPMPDGAAPPFAWTFQPAQSHFDIPVQIEYPNMSGLPAGAETYFLSFNHFTNKFEIIASGAVSNDGSKSRTDPGQGITDSGWGCNCPPYSVTGECKRCQPMPNGCGPAWAGGGNVFTDCGVYLSINCPVVCFSDSCNFHDNCWGTCHSCGGGSRSACDNAFYNMMSATCAGCFLDPPFIEPGNFLRCEAVAYIYYSLVSSFTGDRAYNDAQEIACSCCEISRSTNVLIAGVPEPLAVEKPYVDLDGDLLPDEWEAAVGLDPSDSDDAMIDSDGDYVNNLVEFTHDLDPFDPDTRGTGDGDLSEVQSQQPELPLVIDETWQLSINGQSAIVSEGGLFNIRNVSLQDMFGVNGPGTPPDFVGDDFIRITGVSYAGGGTRYAASDFFQIRQGQAFVVQDVIVSDSPPLSIQELNVVPLMDATNVLTAIDQTTQLQTLATLSDGTENVDVTQRTSWTIYRTSNPSIATVGPNGLVTAKGRGVAFITASNEGATAVTRIVVAPGDPLTTVEGFVFFPDGTPAEGAQITTFPVPSGGFTDADGRYSIPNVPTTFGALQVSASVRVDNVDFTGRIENVNVALGMITDAGIINLVEGGIGGPIILGGDDMTDHGSVDGNGNPQDGWLYIQRAIEDLRPEVFRFGNDGTIAALGSSPSTATSANAGAAIGYAAAAAGIQVNYYDGSAAIDQFFTDLASGVANPAIIWVAGTGAGNDLDSNEGQRLTAHAAEISTFTDSGGGLMAHGSGSAAYGWLTTLVPTITEISSGSDGDLILTLEGVASFPGLTNSDVNAGPWHSHFEGDFGGLQVLVESSSIMDSQGRPAAVIIGGKLVEF